MPRHLASLAAATLLVPTLAYGQGEAAVLSIVNVPSQPTGCHIGLRMTNNCLTRSTCWCWRRRRPHRAATSCSEVGCPVAFQGYQTNP